MSEFRSPDNSMSEGSESQWLNESQRVITGAKAGAE